MRDSVLYTCRITALLLIVALVSSCAMKSDFVELRRDLDIRYESTESRLYALERSIAAVDSLVREQSRLNQSLKALIGSQAQEDRDTVDLIAARQDEINYLLRDLLQKLQAIQLYGGIGASPSPSPAASAPAPSTTTKKSMPKKSTTPQPKAAPASGRSTAKVDPEELYNAALEDIKNERFQLGESRFLSFLMQFPKHKLAGNAQYWIGEAVYGQEKYDLAIKEFETVLKKYKKSPKVPAAKLKIGFAQFKLGQEKAAIQTLNALIKSHPKSEEAELARQRLNAPEE